MIVVAVTLLLCVTAIVLALIFRPMPTPLPPRLPVSILDERLLDQVVVTLKSGTTFAGVLYAEDSGAVVLCKAEQLQPDGSRVSADGEVVVLRGDVDFIQRP